MPTEGSLGDRRRIIHYVEQAVSVGLSATIGDVDHWSTPVAVLDHRGVLIGSLDPAAEALPKETPVTRAMVPAPSTIRPELRVEEVARRLHDDSLEHVFVTAVSGVLLGIVERDRLHA